MIPVRDAIHENHSVKRAAAQSAAALICLMVNQGRFFLRGFSTRAVPELLLFTQRPKSRDRQVDRKHDQHDCKPRLNHTPHIAGFQLGHDRLDQRCQRDDQHEHHRDVEHFFIAADGAEPCTDGEKPERRKQLVGCAEQRPDLGIAGQAERHAEDDRNGGRYVRISQHAPHPGRVLRSLALIQPELLEHIASQSGSCVERSQAEDGDGEDEHLINNALNSLVRERSEHS